MTFDAQPIVDLRTGAATRHELLIRLRDGWEPALGPVLRLDRWVLERAVAAPATPWARESHLRLEVDVSARSLDDAEPGGCILSARPGRGTGPGRPGDHRDRGHRQPPAARDLACKITGAGCGITLDDFGAGFGSFSHLKHLPLTGIKIAG